jgi:Undecaprenyl-phosphate glucose phosphotransferase
MPAAALNRTPPFEADPAPALREPPEVPSEAPVTAVETRPARKARERRGPLRPEHLATTRHREGGRSLATGFRAADVGVIAATTVIVFEAVSPTGLLGSPMAQGAPFVVAAIVAVVALRACLAYDFSHSETLSRHLVKVSAAFGAAGLVGALLLRLWAPEAALLSELGLWCAATFVAVYMLHVWWWAVVRSWRKQGRLVPNIIIVGATENAERLIEGALQSREVHVLGIFDDRGARAPEQIRGVPVLGDTATLMKSRLLPYVDRIVIAVTPSAQDRVRRLIDRLRVLSNPVTLLMELEGYAGPTLSRIADAPLAYVSGQPQDERRAAAKRVQDVVVGLVALLCAAPVMLLVALAIRLDTPGPIFFRQRRQGFNGEEIVVWKFRSMHHAMRDEKAATQARRGDARVTRVGRFIRATSLDELPQILNVLKGEMSLVGPRPHAPEMKTGDVESHKLVADYAHRHRMKPGVTGWAAIKGSRGPVDTPESVRRRVALDVEYIERQSFWLDLYIMAMTVPCLLGDRQTVR